jgi:hypothetical protein
MSTVSGLTPIYNSLLIGTVTPSVTRSAIPGLAQTAASISYQSGIVATLGEVSSSALTYDATGLLNSIAQAGTLTQPALTPSQGLSAQSTVQNLINQDVVNSLPSTPATSGIYTASGVLAGLSSTASANWASYLKSNPNLAATVITDSFNQGIVGTLSTIA